MNGLTLLPKVQSRIYFHRLTPTLLTLFLTIYLQSVWAQNCDIFVTAHNMIQPANNGPGLGNPADQNLASQVINPANFSWNNSGYVRYDIDYLACALNIYINYFASAHYYVDIAHNTPSTCPTCSKSLDKNYQVQISYSALCDQSSMNGTGLHDGEIGITMAPLTGVPPFSIKISSVSGFSQTQTNIFSSATFTGLQGFSWYNVEVYDDGGSLVENDIWIPLCSRAR